VDLDKDIIRSSPWSEEVANMEWPGFKDEIWYFRGSPDRNALPKHIEMRQMFTIDIKS
jgi:hypothetical protein